MLTLDEPRQRTALADGISVALVTRRAEKDFAALGATDRDRVAAALSRPVSGNRYRKLQTGGKVGLYHFDVTDTVRVTCREVDGRACAIHIGTHPNFDEFVAHYTGGPVQNPKPLEESRIMKATPCTPAKVPALTAPKAAPAQPQPLPNAADAFAQYVTLLFETAFAKERDRLNDEVLQFADTIQAVRRDATAEAKGLTTALHGRTDELAAAVAAHGQRLDLMAGAIEAELSDLQDRVAEDHTAPLLAKIDQLERHVGTVREGIEDQLADVYDRLAEDHTAPVTARLNQLESRMQAAREEDAADLHQLRRSLAAALARIGELERAQTTPATPEASGWRALVRGAGDLVATVRRFFSARPEVEPCPR